MSQLEIRKLPPGPERPELHFRQKLTSGSKWLVSVEFKGRGEFESTGISFDDAATMQTSRHVLAPGRRYEAPEWAMNDETLRTLVVVYLERRAEGGGKWHMNTDSEHSDQERINVAQKKLVAQEHFRKAAIVRLCQEYVWLNQKTELSEEEQKRKKKINEEIANLDTTIRVNAKIAAVVIAIVYAYFRRGLDSLSIGTEMNLRPAHVRMVLWRLQRCWERMGGDKPAHKVLRFVRHSRARFAIQPVRQINPASVAAPPRIDERYQSYVDFSKRIGAQPLPEQQWRETYG